MDAAEGTGSRFCPSARRLSDTATVQLGSHGSKNNSEAPVPEWRTSKCSSIAFHTFAPTISAGARSASRFLVQALCLRYLCPCCGLTRPHQKVMNVSEIASMNQCRYSSALIRTSRGLGTCGLDLQHKAQLNKGRIYHNA